MDTLLLILAIVCAIAYGAVIAVLLWSNHKKWEAWLIAAGAIVMWPWLFFMSFMQLVVVIPLVTVFAVNGRDLSRPLSIKAIYWALATTIIFIAFVAVIAILHDSSDVAR